MERLRRALAPFKPTGSWLNQLRPGPVERNMLKAAVPKQQLSSLFADGEGPIREPGELYGDIWVRRSNGDRLKKLYALLVKALTRLSLRERVSVRFVGGIEMLFSAGSDCCGATIWRASALPSRIACRTASARGRKVCPNVVSLEVLGSRSNNFPPSSSSSLMICCDNDGCETCSAMAARVNVPCFTIAQKYLN